MVKTPMQAVRDFRLRLLDDEVADPVLGRLVASGFHDEFKGYFQGYRWP